MSSGSIITGLGLALLFIYGFTKILEFYGVGINVYGSYISFYLFLLISMYILPTEYSKFTI
jgi:hypothetical protein